MMVDFLSLSTTHSLAYAADLALSSVQMDFPVFDCDRAAGAGSRSELFASLEHDGMHATVGEVVRPYLGEANPTDTLHSVLRRLQEKERGFLAVVDGRQFLGLASADSLRVQSSTDISPPGVGKGHGRSMAYGGKARQDDVECLTSRRTRTFTREFDMLAHTHSEFPVNRLRDPEDRTVDTGNIHATRDKMFDKTLADSFPASDPPSTLPDPTEDSFCVPPQRG